MTKFQVGDEIIRLLAELSTVHETNHGTSRVADEP